MKEGRRLSIEAFCQGHTRSVNDLTSPRIEGATWLGTHSHR